MPGSFRWRAAPALLVPLLLGACVSMPSGPTTMVLPGTSKSFDEFRIDDADCRQFAQSQLGGESPASTYTDSGVRSAAFGTVLGALAGAAVNGSHGAGVGAATGLAMGGLAGTSAAQTSGYGAQRRYDIGYQQCMYAKGHKIPGSARYISERPAVVRPAQSYQRIPAPPAGTPPPPPLR